MLERIENSIKNFARAVRGNTQALVSALEDLGRSQECLYESNTVFNDSAEQAEVDTMHQVAMMKNMKSVLGAAKDVMNAAANASKSFLSPELAVKITEYCADAMDLSSEALKTGKQTIEGIYGEFNSSPFIVRKEYNDAVDAHDQMYEGVIHFRSNVVHAIRDSDLIDFMHRLEERKIACGDNAGKKVFFTNVQNSTALFRPDDAILDV